MNCNCAPEHSMSIPQKVALGLDFLNNNVDKKRGCLPYFFTDFKNDPAWSRHDWPDYGDLTGRYVEAFAKARRLLGIMSPGEVETEVRELLMSYFDSGDGLSYRPKPDKPYYSGILDRMYDLHVAEGFDQSRVMWGLLGWYVDTGDAAVRRKMEELLAGLRRVMVIRDDYGFYDRAMWNAGDVIPQDASPMKHQLYFAGGQIHPLIEIYRRLEIPLALELSKRLTEFVVNHSEYFIADGSWNCAGVGDWASSTDGHVHSRLATIAGVATVGRVTADESLISWARRAYDWFVKKHSCDFGWGPEFLQRHGDDNEGCETCAVMDDINCALALAEAGFTEYYDRAERVTRNQLMESQLTDTSLVRNTVEKSDTEQECFHSIASMVRGGFAGWAGPNDFVGNCANNYCLMNCCGPSGVTALCNIWDNIYSRDGQRIFLNIWMDKEDDVVSIKNLEPVKGLLEICLKKSRVNTVYVRRPAFLDVQGVEISVNGKRADFANDGQYMVVEGLKEGDRLEARYDLNESVEDVHVNGRAFKVAWAGNTVMGMDPCGKVMPFYAARRSWKK